MTSLRTMACTLMILATAAEEVVAQFLDDQPRLVAGPMAGVSFANFRGSNAGDTDARTGLVAGAFLTYAFTPYFGIEPQLLYVQKGASYHADSAGVQLNSSTELTYLEIPLLFKARYPIGSGRWPLMMSAIAGPAVGLKLNCTNHDADGTMITCGERPEDPFNQDPTPAGVDLSGIFGVGLDYGHFAFQARYDLSITNSFTFVSSLYPYLKNQAWELTLGYKIEIN